MTIPDKLDLCEANRVQTQILYGTPVLVAEEREGWVKVLIPDQKTRKEALGYPGWMPKRQLIEAAWDDGKQDAETAQWAVIASKKAALYREPKASPSLVIMELSFLTSLPYIGQAEDWVRVRTPHGEGFMKSADVRVSFVRGMIEDGGNRGERIVRQAERFLGLPYLWGGLSAYGYDCSGFAYSMHKSQGILISRDASEQAAEGIAVEKDALEPGDLLFFAHEEGKGRVHHVGIYAGNGRMIHSPDSASCVEIVELSGYKLANEHCGSRRYWS
jgi:cell wall-associated NlpC family hydrolase